MSRLFADLAEDAEPRRLVVGLWVRRAIMTAFAVIVVLALIGIFGQRASESTARSPAASLRLSAPKRVRGGLFFQSRIEVRALRAIQHPRLVLASGWLEGMQVNSIEPSAVGEAYRDGRLVLSYDTLDAGDTLVVWLQFEVDPTEVGGRSYGVELDDAETKLAVIDHHLRVLP